MSEVTFDGSPYLSCKRAQQATEMRGYMDRRVTPPKRVTSSTWGPPPPCKQSLTVQKTVGTSNVKKNNSFVRRNLHGCKARE